MINKYSSRYKLRIVPHSYAGDEVIIRLELHFATTRAQTFSKWISPPSTISGSMKESCR